MPCAAAEIKRKTAAVAVGRRCRMASSGRDDSAYVQTNAAATHAAAPPRSIPATATSAFRWGSHYRRRFCPMLRWP